MNIAEVIKIRDRLKAELDTVEKFLAIARREGLDSESSSTLTVRTPEPESQRTMPTIVQQTNGEYGHVGRFVWEAIKLCPVEFSVGDVHDAANKDVHPLSRTQISTALARLTKQGKLQVIKEKKGKSPAVYRRI